MAATVKLNGGQGNPMDEPRIADLYEPLEEGWQIWITRDEQAPRLAPGSRIGVVAPLPGSRGHEHNPELEKRRPQDDPRLHRRPLFPPRVEKDLGHWTLIDLKPVFNAALTEVLERVLAAARPPVPL